MRIAIAGLGTVGSHVARSLINQTDTGLSEGNGGVAVAAHLLHHPRADLTLVAVSARQKDKDRGFPLGGIDFTADATTLAHRGDVDCIVELIGGEGGVALQLAEAAIKNGKHFITANKALLSRHGATLAQMAEARGVALMGEASVAGGIPCLKMLREGLAANRIKRISGILNGTSNFILTEMERSGQDFDTVLTEAQTLGYAEADPSFDIDGIDAAHKLSLLAGIAFGITPDLTAIRVSGIRDLSAVDSAMAKQLGLTIRLLGMAEMGGQSVQPVMLPDSSQLAKVEGVLNAVAIEAEPVGVVTAIGPGAGAGATASAVLADLCDVAEGRITPFFGRAATTLTANRTDNGGEAPSRFYIRAQVYDRPGVLADITAVLNKYGISVESIIQPSPDEMGGEAVAATVPVMIITHAITPASMQGSVAEIAELECVVQPPVSITISDGRSTNDA